MTFLLFIARGPWRAIHGNAKDFSAPYTASLRLKAHLNPYSSSEFLSTLYAAGAHPEDAPDLSGRHPIYPPNALLFFVPFSLLNWPHAVAVYTGLCTILYLALILKFTSMIGDRWDSWRRIGFLAFALALAPTQTALSIANPSALTVCLCLFALIFLREQRQIPAGICLACALAIKPSCGAFILVLILIARCWKSLATLIVLYATVSLAAIACMAHVPSSWRADYQENVAFLFGPTGAANFASHLGGRFDDLNLQLPLFELTQNKNFANVGAWLIAALLFALWVRLAIRKHGSLFGWDLIGSLVLLGLLPVYQRNYNAGFILLPVLWAFLNLDKTIARWTLAVSCAFLLPFEAILRAYSPRLPVALTNSILWNAFILPSAVWATVTLTILLLCAMANPQNQVLEPEPAL